MLKRTALLACLGGRATVSVRTHGRALLLPAARGEGGRRGPLRESEQLRIVERPPHPRRVLVFRLAVWPSPRKRGEVRLTRPFHAKSGTHGRGLPRPACGERVGVRGTLHE